MGGMTLMDEFDWVESEAAPPTTLVLMGRTGNGKSATGNSILGRPAFKSRSSSSAVTCTCQLESATLPDGRVIRVVDTPGFFEVTMSDEDIKTEVVKCFNLAKDGVHALLLVLSTRNRFTAEELAMVDILQVLFGEKVLEYVIVVFTGGDELEEDERTLEEYCEEAPDVLKHLLDRCGNRTILFNNRTKHKAAKERQAAQLLQTVADMVRRNGGKPYTNELFREAQVLAQKSKEKAMEDKQKLVALNDQYTEMKLLKVELERAYTEQLHAMTAMVEEKLRLSAERLEAKLAEEQRARELVEKQAHKFKVESEKSIKELQQRLDEALKQSEELRRARGNGGGCKIL